MSAGVMTEGPMAAALRPEEVMERLKDSLPECREGLELLRCDISEVRYKAGAPCWILYRLKIRHPTRRSRELLLSARLLEHGAEAPPLPPDLVQRYERGSGHVLRSSRILLRDPAMVLHPYPLDAGLPGLIEALDPAAMKVHLSRMWESRRTRVRSVEIRTLGYTPDARAALRYEVLAEDRGTGVPEVRHLIAKLHGKKPAARLFADAWAVWRASSPSLGLAPPVGYVERAGLHLQEEVPGERLGGIVTSHRVVRAVRQTAGMLAELHGLRVPLSSRRLPSEEIRSVQRWSGVLSAIRPDLAPRIERLVRDIGAQIELRGRMTGPLHADFHHTNVLVHDSRVTIIDLDEIAYGDSLVDVGRFLASLRIPALRAFGDPTALQDAGQAFLAAYVRRRSADVSRIRLFEAASLFTAAASAFRIQRTNWREEVELLLDEAGRVAHDAASGVPLSVPVEIAPLEEPELSNEERLRWARDCVHIQAALDPHVREEYGADVLECRLRESGSPRRIHYRLRGRLGDEPWSVELRGITGYSGGTGLVRRLRALRAALAETPGAPLLPRPVAHLRRICVLAWEVPTGTPLHHLERPEAIVEAAGRVGAAFRGLHGVPVELDRTISLGSEVRAVRRRIERLRATVPEATVGVSEIWTEVESRCQGFHADLAPSLRIKPGRDIVLGEGLGFVRVRDVTLAHPIWDAARFLAYLTLRLGGASTGGVLEASAEAFRAAYDGSSGLGPRDSESWATLEAAALLHVVVDRLGKEPDWAGADLLVARARCLLDS